MPTSIHVKLPGNQPVLHYSGKRAASRNPRFRHRVLFAHPGGRHSFPFKNKKHKCTDFNKCWRDSQVRSVFNWLCNSLATWGRWVSWDRKLWGNRCVCWILASLIAPKRRLWIWSRSSVSMALEVPEFRWNCSDLLRCRTVGLSSRRHWWSWIYDSSVTDRTSLPEKISTIGWDSMTINLGVT